MQTDGRTDRWTDKAKPVVPFRNFANAPKTNLHTKDTRPQTRRVKSYVFSICISLSFRKSFLKEILN